MLNESLSSLKNKNSNKYGYTSCLIGGLEEIKDDYEDSSLRMSSLVSILREYSIKSIDTIYRKNDVRTIYNTFTNS